MKKCFLYACVFAVFSVNAQSLSKREQNAFLSNQKVFAKYLAKNIRYPAEARNNCVQQGTLARFMFNAKGGIDTAYTSPNTHPALAGEVNRLLKNAPPFVLTKLADGSVIRGKRYVIAVRFRIEDEACQPEPEENRLFDKLYIQGKTKIKNHVMLSPLVIVACPAIHCGFTPSRDSLVRPGIPLPRVEIKPVPLKSPK